MLTEDAITYFKSKSKVASALGISPAAVSQWGKHVPLLRQYQLQGLSGGFLKVSTFPQAAVLAA
ncbi:Cro/Cl family transcriptional regulator [Pseudomonas sp. FSL R10-0765]|uniref:Cro/CI family transcriptional regulator n=1 Tax=Pseudomonas sp. FSL R10-0765 TaxID=2662195 RepID=UPI001296A3ED|nr:Cro/CI family transcriptional regulator [Pseudomonas sp. FSL R10-0765]MQT41380.1 Cro/Cl family transcriptional regulator [Pseudomonas sp. FSL R10-0765]